MCLSNECMSPSDIKNDDLELWGIQYFYEFYGQLCNHDPKAVKQQLEERFNAEQLQRFYKWQKNKFKIWIDENIKICHSVTGGRT